MKLMQLRAAALALAACGALSAHAADGNYYIGGNIGGPDYRGSVNSIGSGSGSGVAGRIYGGYQFNPNFAVEAGGFDLGHLSDGTGKVDLRGVYVDAVGTYSFIPQWSLVGRAGLAEGRFRSTNGDDSSPALRLGLGVQYDINRQVALRAEYERNRFVNAFDGKPQVGMFSVGLKYAF